MVQGLAAFQRRWRAIPAKVQAEVKKTMEDIAEEIVAQMYSVAPHQTGDLAGSIGWTWGDAPKGSFTIGSVGQNEYATLRITIYAGDKDAFYARWQEFGTTKMPANPFFYPVWRVKRRSAQNRMTRAINKAIKAS
ncbi:HK97-gp10 family putative phage morphogenesis protein [Loktanella salsilacus]|uniref:HK97-gp10 family putative phage morphogenesis protein n=1 Tax=Loktanella salsilacus TaxID=195913 RepID=UPI00370458E1